MLSKLCLSFVVVIDDVIIVVILVFVFSCFNLCVCVCMRVCVRVVFLFLSRDMTIYSKLVNVCTPAMWPCVASKSNSMR